VHVWRLSDIALTLLLGVSGIDDTEIGEFAYDYVELSRDVQQQEVGGDENPDSNDGISQRSHSQVAILHSVKDMPGESYPMHVMNCEGRCQELR